MKNPFIRRSFRGLLFLTLTGLFGYGFAEGQSAEATIDSWLASPGSSVPPELTGKYPGEAVQPGDDSTLLNQQANDLKQPD